MASKNTQLSERTSHPLTSFKNEMNEFFDRFTKEIFPSGETSGFMPKVELKDNGQNYQLCAELPGLKEEDINVTLKDNTLIIEGEKRNESKREGKGFFRSEISYGSFYRAIPLASDVNPESVTATYKDGVLKVTLEKSPEDQSRAKKITINRSKQGQETKH